MNSLAQFPDLTESTPIYDELHRDAVIERTGQLFEEAAEEIWPTDQPYVAVNVPTQEEWENLMKYLAASLMTAMSEPDALKNLFPEGGTSTLALRHGELRAIGCLVALKALENIEYPEWEDA